MDNQICPLTANGNYFSIAYIPYIYQPVCSDAMAYAGLCFWKTLKTQNSVKDQIGGELHFKWEHNISRVNGMTPKDIKPSSSYPQISYTIARKKINKSIENKKKNIYLYIHHMYIYILYKQQL